MNAYAVSLAVVAGRGNRETKVFELNYGLFHGTAFCLAPHLFLTAGHVYRDAKGDGEVALARLGPERQQATILPGNPPGYEVSFVPPAGLSGAPLLTTALGGPPVAVGMILQHHIAEFRDRRMELGLVLDIEELLTIDSRS